MREVGKGFVYPHHLMSLETINTYPDIVHRYGMRLPSPDQPMHWMTYKVSGNVGEISFLRRIHAVYPEFTDYVCEYLKTLFNHGFIPERVNFMRTRGSVQPHVDEAGRKCTVNIGVLNSSSAVTYQSDTLDITKWDKTKALATRCQDGSAYLVNTSRLHSVEGTKGVDRFLVAYGFNTPYGEVLRLLKPTP